MYSSRQGAQSCFVTPVRLRHTRRVEIDDVDYASMVARLEERMERKDVAAALDVDEKTIDDIASGYVPGEHVAARLRALAEPETGADSRSPRVSRRMLMLFVICDAIFFVALAVVLLLVR